MTSTSQPLTDRRVLITQFPVGKPDPAPIECLMANGFEITMNPFERIMNEAEMLKTVSDFPVIFSGTSPLSRRVIEKAQNLKFVARAGIGLDSVDLLACRERGIPVSYTPDAPAPAVAEFTIGMMLSLTRHITQADRKMRAGEWKRMSGTRLENATIGVLGVGRTGKRVIRYLHAFGCKFICNDLEPDEAFGEAYGVTWTDKKTLIEQSDILTLHIPCTKLTRHLLDSDAFKRMKASAMLINTSRGGIVNDTALAEALVSGRIAAAAMDVFEKEPYSGPLTELDNCILTSHMAAASADCSRAMELGAAMEIVRFANGEALASPVPESEYKLRES